MEKIMPKAAIIVLADTETHGDLGRVVNALEAVKELKEARDEVKLIFDGAGTQWIPPPVRLRGGSNRGGVRVLRRRVQGDRRCESRESATARRIRGASERSAASCGWVLDHHVLTGVERRLLSTL
jgi:hypothetical protein